MKIQNSVMLVFYTIHKRTGSYLWEEEDLRMITEYDEIIYEDLVVKGWAQWP